MKRAKREVLRTFKQPELKRTHYPENSKWEICPHDTITFNQAPPPTLGVTVQHEIWSGTQIQTISVPLSKPPSYGTSNFTPVMPPHNQLLARVLEQATPSLPAFTHACCTVECPLLRQVELSSETQLRCHFGAFYEPSELLLLWDTFEPPLLSRLAH